MVTGAQINANAPTADSADKGPKPRPCKTGKTYKGDPNRCPSPTPTGTIDPTPTETPLPQSIGLVGFGTRRITPVGDTASWPPPAWKQFLTPHPVTKVWGEPYTDTNGNECYDEPALHRRPCAG